MVPPRHRVAEHVARVVEPRHRRLVAALVRVVLQREAPVRRPEVPICGIPRDAEDLVEALDLWWCWGRRRRPHQLGT